MGSYADSSGPQRTLIEYWDSYRWQVVKSPSPTSALNAQLFGVAALSSSNVWAVGMFKDQQNAAHALIEHWNGSTWSIVSAPTPNGSGDQLYSMAVISPADIWAVGTYADSHLALQTLIEHWNGSQWSIVSSPQPEGSIQSQLLGVTAISANNVWAVGRADGKRDASTLIEHWKGSQWSIVSSPNTRQPGNILMAVTAISASNIWATGSSFAEFGSYLSRSLIEHWNGSAWGIVSSPTGVSNPSTLQAVTSVPTLTAIWAVGSHFSSTLSEPLIERYC